MPTRARIWSSYRTYFSFSWKRLTKRTSQVWVQLTTLRAYICWPSANITQFRLVVFDAVLTLSFSVHASFQIFRLIEWLGTITVSYRSVIWWARLCRTPLLLLFITALFFTTPITIFGAGIVEQTSELYEYNACDGDIGNLLAPLPLSFWMNKLFTSSFEDRLWKYGCVGQSRKGSWRDMKMY